MKHTTLKELKAAGAAARARALVSGAQFSDVFAVVNCSRCGAEVLHHEGHASAFQQKLFSALAIHKRMCSAIAKLFPEIPR